MFHKPTLPVEDVFAQNSPVTRQESEPRIWPIMGIKGFSQKRTELCKQLPSFEQPKGAQTRGPVELDFLHFPSTWSWLKRSKIVQDFPTVDPETRQK